MKDGLFVELRAAAGDEGRRLDRVLRKALPDLPLSRIHRLLREGKIKLEGRRAGPDERVHAGQIIRVPAEGAASGALLRLTHKNPQTRQVPGELSAGPGLYGAEIVFESPDLLVLNKPAGLAVHGPRSLDSRVKSYLGPRLPPSLSFSPGPLHRLDKPTSGIVVFSASLAGARFFSALLRDGLLVKRYLAVAEGSISKGGVWEDGLLRDRDLRKTLGAEQGKPARTRFEPLSRGKGFTLLELRPETGRTHQIRAQAALHGCPLAGDRKYGSRTDIPGRNRAGGISFLLHAWRLEIPPGRAGETPAGEEGPVLPPLLEAPVPGYFRETLFDLFGKYAQNFR